MSQKSLLNVSLFQAFQQNCSWVIPTASSCYQYVDVVINEQKEPTGARVFGEPKLTQEQKDQAAQWACWIFGQFKLQASVVYQVKLEAEKANFMILKLESPTVQVHSVSDGLVEIQMGTNIVAVPTLVEHSPGESVAINFQPFPTIYGEEDATARQDQAIGQSPSYQQPTYPSPYSGTDPYASGSADASSWSPPYANGTYMGVANSGYDSGASPPTDDLMDFQVDVTNIDVEEYSETSGLCRLPIRSLANCSRYNQQLTEKALSLSTRYTHWRKARGDGNCYYRSVAIGYLEYLCRNSTPLSLFYHFYMKIFEQREVEIPDELAGYYREFLSPFKKLYSQKKAGQSLEGLQDCLQNPHFDLGVVAVFRCLALYTFNQLKNHPDFAPFLIEGTGDAISADIARMGNDAEGLVFQAMANALDAKIVHITLSSASSCRDDTFQPLTPGQKVVLHLLLRPGHYDVLYPTAVQKLDQYSYSTNSFRNPPQFLDSDSKDYFETL
jgi:ubiquitin thioesterase protein OTUB1